MANPQKENGYTPISNEILDAIICRNIPACPRSILDIIMRNSWGWSKKNVKMSFSFIVKATGMSRGVVCRAVRYLINNNIIKKVPGGGKTSTTYSIQKDHQKWLIFPRVVTAETLVGKKLSTGLSTTFPKKEKIFREKKHSSDTRDATPHRAGSDTTDAQKNKIKQNTACACAHNNNPNLITGSHAKLKINDIPVSFPQDCYSENSLKIEIEILKNIGMNSQDIKTHLIMRGVTEALIDKALGKEF